MICKPLLKLEGGDDDPPMTITKLHSVNPRMPYPARDLTRQKVALIGRIGHRQIKQNSRRHDSSKRQGDRAAHLKPPVNIRAQPAKTGHPVAAECAAPSL